MAVLARLHAEAPLVTWHDRHKVQAQLDYVGDDAVVQGAVERLLSEKKLLGDLRRIARADFKPKLSANLRKLKDKVVAAYLAAAFQPPEPSSFANQAGGNAASLKDLFDVCVAEGFLVQVADEIYLHADVETTMRSACERSWRPAARARPWRKFATCSGRHGSSQCHFASI